MAPPPQIMQKKKILLCDFLMLILLSLHIGIHQNIWLHVDAKRCDATKLD